MERPVPLRIDRCGPQQLASGDRFKCQPSPSQASTLDAIRPRSIWRALAPLAALAANPCRGSDLMSSANSLGVGGVRFHRICRPALGFGSDQTDY